MLGHFRYRRAYRISDVGQRRITGPLLAREATTRRHRIQVSGLTPGGAILQPRSAQLTMQILQAIDVDFVKMLHRHCRGQRTGDRREITNLVLDRGAPDRARFLDRLLAFGGVVVELDLAVLARSEAVRPRSEEHPSELQSLMRISYACFC